MRRRRGRSARPGRARRAIPRCERPPPPRCRGRSRPEHSRTPAGHRRRRGPIGRCRPPRRHRTLGSRGTWGCSARLAATSCDPRGMPPMTMPSASWHPGSLTSWRSSSISTNGVGLDRSAEASRGAARPRTENPTPLITPSSVGVGPAHHAVGHREEVEERRGVVVEAIERHPTHGSLVRLRPFSQQRGLAVAGRSGDADHPAIAGTSRIDERPSTDRVRSMLGDRELGIEQRAAQLDHRQRLAIRLVAHMSRCYGAPARRALQARSRAAMPRIV